MWVMAALKLKVACPAWGASGMGVHPEEELAELDGLGVLHQHLPHDALDHEPSSQSANNPRRPWFAPGWGASRGIFTSGGMMSGFWAPKVTRAPPGPSAWRSRAPPPPPGDERRPRAAPRRRPRGTRLAR